MMECNKDEAVRAKEIAERKFSEREYIGAKKFAIKAQSLYPDLEDVPQFLTTIDIYISAENKVSGEMDWYGILGVSPFADEETVRKQYRKLALTLHPDKNKSLGAEGAFKLVSEAWSLLSDKTKRLEYNQKRSLKSFQHNTPNRGHPSAAPSSNSYYHFKKNTSSNVRAGNNNVRAGNNNVRAPATSVPPPQKKAETFWTICNRCRTHYEYLRVYLSHTLLCPNCNEAFVAVERGPPPNVFKPSSSPPLHQQHQNSRRHPGSNNSNPQWGSHSRMAGFGSTDGSSSVAAQAASVVQKASEKVKREGAPSIAEWERIQMSKRADGSMKKRRTDDMRANGYPGYMANHMAMGHGATGLGSFSESGKVNMDKERIYGFSGLASKHNNSTRELSMFELRNMLVDKARNEIRKKLEEWKLRAEARIINKNKENKRHKNTLNDKTTGSVKYRESNVNGNKHVSIDSSPVISDDSVKSQAYVTINVPDPDFHNFDLDRAESSFAEDQVWAAYDDDDGMPRYYARIHKVISIKPFRMRISWLNSRNNTELGPIDWVGSGFYKTCGDFRTGKHEVTESLNSFSHKVRWTKGNRGVVRIFPGRGEVWALYRNWSPDWNEHTPDEVIHKYDMVEVLDDFSEEQGISVTPLVKFPGFRTVFRRHQDQNEVKRIPKEEMFRFSHQVPNHLLSGQEAHNAPIGCRELDPAATPLDLLQIETEAYDTAGNVKKA